MNTLKTHLFLALLSLPYLVFTQGDCVSLGANGRYTAPSTRESITFAYDLLCSKYDTIDLPVSNQDYLLTILNPVVNNSYIVVEDLEDNLIVSGTDSVEFNNLNLTQLKVSVFEAEQCSCTVYADGILSTADYTLECLSCSPGLILNDSCIHAMTLAVSTSDNCTLSDTLSTGNATVQSSTCHASDVKDIWLKFNATQTTLSFYLEVLYGSASLQTELLSGTCGTLTNVACFSENDAILTNLTPGNEYFLRLYNTDTSTFTVFQVCLTSNLPPVNNYCDQALPLAVSPSQNAACTTFVNLSIGYATNSLDENGCTFNSPVNDVWYKFTATKNTHLFRLEDESPYVSMSIYDGSCISLSLLDCDRAINDYHLYSGLTIGSEYLIRFVGQVNDDFDLCISSQSSPPPVHDECAGAISLAPQNELFCTGTLDPNNNTRYATQSQIACDGSVNADDDVWYKFVATSDRHVISIFNFVNSFYDGPQSGIIELFEGSCGNLNSIRCGSFRDYDGGSFVFESLIVGQQYYFRLYTDHNHDYMGYFVCIGTPPPTPSNDECSGAISLPINNNVFCSESISGTTVGASASNVESCSSNYPNDDDVWYKFTAIYSTHALQFSSISASLGSGTEPRISINVFENSCGNLNKIDCKDFSNASFTDDVNFHVINNLVAGNEYYVNVYSQENDQYVQFDICLMTGPPAPPNDKCLDAEEIQVYKLGNESFRFGTTFFAAYDSLNRDIFSCGSPNPDVWYRFTAINNRAIVKLKNIRDSNNGEEESLGLNLYDICTQQDTCLQSDHIFNYTNNVILQDLIPQQEYLLRINSYGFIDYADFEIAVCYEDSPLNDDCSTSINLPVSTYNNCTFERYSSTGASRSMSNTTFAEADDDVWFDFVATDTSLVIALRNTASSIDGDNSSYAFDLYEGDCAGLTLLQSAAFNSTRISNLIVGQSYYLRVYSYPKNDFIDFDICISETPNNVNCNSAIALPFDSYNQCIYDNPGTNLGALSNTLPQSYCQDSYTIWYSFMPTTTSAIVSLMEPNYVDPKNSPQPSSILIDYALFPDFALFDLDCDSVDPIICRNNQEHLIVTDLSPGVTYYLAISSSGPVTFADICVRQYTNLPANDCDAGASANGLNTYDIVSAISDPQASKYDWHKINLPSDGSFKLTFTDFISSRKDPPVVPGYFDSDLTYSVYREINNNCNELEPLATNVNANHWGFDYLSAGDYWVRLNTDLESEVTAYYTIQVQKNFGISSGENCSNPIVLIVNQSSECSSSYMINGGQYNQSFVACGGSNDADEDTWFLFTASTGEHQIHVSDLEDQELDGNVWLELMENNCTVDTFTSIICAQKNEIVVSDLTPGQHYLLRTYTKGFGLDSELNYRICIHQAIDENSNPNLSCLAAKDLIPISSDCDSPERISTYFANPSSACTGIGNDVVWTKFTATDSVKTVEISSIICEDQNPGGSKIVSEVFEGSCGNLSQIYCDSSFSYELANLQIGGSYYIKFHSYDNTFCEFNVCLSSKSIISRPANDDFEDATGIFQFDNNSCPENSANISTFFKATEDGLAACNGNSHFDIWYSFTANSSNPTIQVDAQVDVVLEVVAANGETNLFCINNSSGSSESFQTNNLITGTQYYLRVYPFSTTGIPPIVSDSINSYVSVCVFGPPDKNPDGSYADGVLLPNNTYGFTAGTFSVSENGGAAYVIPLVIPSGVTGMKPELAINYSSRGSNGILGAKFSLAGLSFISRKGRDLAYDGEATPVRFDSSDIYMLDGNRLVNWTSQTYGSDNCEYRLRNNEFKRIKSYGNVFNSGTPEKFEVWTKDGLLYEYGFTEDSRIQAKGRHEILYWAVNKITDTKGNYITFIYEEDAVNGYFYPSEIQYTSNDAMGISAPYHVTFDYESRTDIAKNYIAGSLVSIVKRLSKIEVLNEGTVVRSYNMNYQEDDFTKISQLVSIQECGLDGKCLNPTIFEWENSQDFFDVSPSVINNPIPQDSFKYKVDIKEHWIQVGSYTHQNIWRKKEVKDYQLFLEVNYQPVKQDVSFDADFNGDGLADIIIHNLDENLLTAFKNSGDYNFMDSTMNCPLSIPEGWILTSLDINSDGFADFMVYDTISGSNRWYINKKIVQFNNIDFQQVNNLIDPSELSYNSSLGFRMPSFRDLNGDGLADLVIAADEDGTYRKFFVNTGQNSFLQNTGAIPANSLSFENYFFDFDGDGLTDLVNLNRSTKENFWYRNISTTYPNPKIEFELVRTNAISPLSLPISAVFKTGDFNGDGMTDLLVYSAFKSDIQTSIITSVDPIIFINRGNFIFSKVDNYSLHEFWITIAMQPTDYYLVPYDVNGDGADDLMYYNNAVGYFTVAFNDGEGHFLTDEYDGFRDELVQRDLISKGAGIKFVNYRRGNLLSLMWSDIISGNNRIIDFDIDLDNNDIVKITNGHDQRILITSDYLTNSKVYQRELNSTYPETDFLGQYKVVSNYKIVDEKNVAIEDMSYCYRYGKVDLLGSGFKGFKEFEIKDNLHQTKQIIYRQTDSKFLNSPIHRIDKVQSNGLVLSINNQQLTIDSLMSPKGQVVYYSYPSRVDDVKYEIDGSDVSTIVKKQINDGFGNIICNVVDYGNGFIDSTHNIYDDDLTKWYLGRLTKTEIHRSGPGLTPVVREIEFEYDPVSGLLVKEISDPNQGNDRIEKTYVHDGFGNIIQSSTIAWNGQAFETRSFNSEYDVSGRFLEKQFNDLNHSSEISYHPVLGLKISESDPNGLVTQYEYDDFGRSVKITNPDATWTTYTYGKCNGNCPESAYSYKRVQHKVGPATTTFYDGHSRELEVQSEGFNGRIITQQTRYDIIGRVSRESDPYYLGDAKQWTTYQYDILDRLIEVRRPGNRISQTLYEGLQTTYINELGQIKSSINSEDGRLLSVSDDNGNIIEYFYDVQRNLIEIKDPLNNSIHMTYDLQGYKTSVDDPNMGVYQYNYNRFGELISQTYPSGDEIKVEYDILGRIINRDEPEGISTWVYDQSNNGIGLLSTVNSYHFQGSYQYDNLSRISSEISTIEGQAYQMSYSYDSLGRVSQVEYPSDLTLEYEYDEQNLLRRVKDLNSSVIYYELQDINAIGQVIREKLGNGLITENVYESDRRFLIQRITKSEIAPIQDLSWEYDQLSNLLSRTNSYHGFTEYFTYDNLNRLTSYTIPGVDTTLVEYDILGNITSKSDVGQYFYGENNAGPNQLTRIQGADITCVPSATTNFHYTSFEKVDTISNDSIVLEIKYAHARQRVVQTTSKNGSLVEKKIYIGNAMEIVTDSSGNVHKKLFIRGVADVVAVKNVTDTAGIFVHYWHKDHQSSLQTISDENGEFLSDLFFDPWGLRRNPTNGASLNPFKELPNESYDRGYTSHEHIDIFKLINMNGRIQDPVLGRFISPDPFIQDASNLQNLNRYSYVFNNPLKYTDPSGYFGILNILNIGISSRGSNSYTPGAEYSSPDYSGILIATDQFHQTVNRSEGLLGLDQEDWNQVAVITASLAGSFVGGGPFVAAAVSGFLSSATSTLLYGGTLGDAFESGFKGAAIGLATAYAAGIIGHYSDVYQTGFTAKNFAIKTIGHGVTQGLASELQGGKFEHGFWSGAVTGGLGEFTAAKFNDWGVFEANSSLEYLFAGTVGGLSSQVAGGKFVNGAITGVVVFAFNKNKMIFEDGESDHDRNIRKLREWKAAQKEAGEFATREMAKFYYENVLPFTGLPASAVDIGTGFYDLYNGDYDGAQFNFIKGGSTALMPPIIGGFAGMGMDFLRSRPYVTPVDRTRYHYKGTGIKY